MVTLTLTDDQAALLGTAISMAVEIWKKDAETARELAATRPSFERIAKQLDDQIRRALEILVLLP